MESNIFLGLGSNIGDKINYLKQAVELIARTDSFVIVKTSSVYESLPYGKMTQDNYFNAVINVSTKLNPNDLFRFLKNIERVIGRKNSTEKWAPREIDIDILFYNQLIYTNDDVTIPHKEFMKRDFVIVPMSEIAADFKHPATGIKIADINTDDIEKNILRKIDHSIL